MYTDVKTHLQSEHCRELSVSKYYHDFLEILVGDYAKVQDANVAYFEMKLHLLDPQLILDFWPSDILTVHFISGNTGNLD